MRGGFLNAACGGTLSRSAATYAPEHWLHCRPEFVVWGCDRERDRDLHPLKSVKSVRRFKV